jgi:hypothetical protein
MQNMITNVAFFNHFLFVVPLKYFFNEILNLFIKNYENLHTQSFHSTQMFTIYKNGLEKNPHCTFLISKNYPKTLISPFSDLGQQ